MTDSKPGPDPTENDERSDIQQAVEARSDAVARGVGGRPSPVAGTVSEDSAGGAGGRVKNQDENQQ